MALHFLLVISASLWAIVLAVSRTSPPAGSIVVRAGTTTAGEYKTVASAVASLPNDSSSRTIFIYPGTYNEQVYITRSGPLTIYGYTTDTMTYSANQVTIQAGIPASQAGSNDASGTLRVHKDNFKLYNVNVKNTYGQGSQAIAISQYGNKVGFYACGFYGYQDTVLVNQGTQVFLKGFIQGATDFIFGGGAAYFGGNTISVNGAGWVTASGRSSNDGTSYVFNQNTIVLASGTASSANGKIYLGRPWRPYAKVIFKNTVITAPMNKALWAPWREGDDTSNVYYAEYNTSGSGASGASRPSFARVLSASDANNYNIGSAVGSDYGSWVDSAYVV